MRRAVRHLTLIVFALAMLPTGPHAAGRVSLMNAIGLIDYSRKPDFRPGMWAKYRVVGHSELGMHDDYLLTVLIPGNENFWGEDCFWVETWTERVDGPASGVATLMSYAIFDDSLAIPHLQLYTRKTITEFNEDGTPRQDVVKRPARTLQARTPPSDRIRWDVDTVGTDTVVTPRGTYSCRKISIRQGVAATTDVGDSTLRTEVRDNRMVYMSPEVPITHVAREDIDYSIVRKTWAVGRSQEIAENTMERSKGGARLVDYGTGLKPRIVILNPRASLDGKPAASPPKSSPRKASTKRKAG